MTVFTPWRESEVPVTGSHIAWRQSPFGYKAQSWVSKALDTDRRLFFSLLYFHFRTLDSALQRFSLAYNNMVNLIHELVIDTRIKPTISLNILRRIFSSWKAVMKGKVYRAMAIHDIKFKPYNFPA